MSSNLNLTPESAHAALRKKKISKVTGIILCILQILGCTALMTLLIRLNVLPIKYVIAGGVVLALISFYNLFSQFTKVRWLGKVLAVLLIILSIIGVLYLNKTYNALNQVSGNKVETTDIAIIVNSNDSAQTLADAKKYSFGYVADFDTENTNKAITEVNNRLGSGSDIMTVAYKSFDELQTALYNKQVQAIFMNESMRYKMEEIDADFSTKTRVLDKVTITKELKEAVKKSADEPFALYIAGNDEEGALVSSGRNDVNLLAVVNPKSHQILLITTPRDSYVDILQNDDAGTIAKDKLTHAGIYGVEHSMDALNRLYGIQPDYYFRLNFTGCVGIVDALGGITIDSKVEFTTTPDTWPDPIHFEIGENKVDGIEALAFCRERKAFARGDFQRGENQMVVMQAIIDKVSSPDILTHYMQVLDAIDDMFVTSMPSEKITELARTTLNSTEGWNVQTYSAQAASTGSAYSALEKMNLSMVFLNDDSIKIAKEMVAKINNGEKFDVDAYSESRMAQLKEASKAGTATTKAATTVKAQ